MDWGLGLVANNPLTKGLVSGAQAVGQGLASAGHAVVQGADRLNMNLGQALDNYMHPVVPDVDTFAQRGYPAYMTDANKDWVAKGKAQALLGNYDPKTLPQQMSNLQVYRADPTGRYGGTDGLETMPTKFGGQALTLQAAARANATGDPSEIYAGARNVGRAFKYGVPQISAQQLAAMVLKEGRADYGANMFDYNNPQLNALADKLYPNRAAQAYDALTNPTSGKHSVNGAQVLPLAIAEKMATAKRLNIPFAEAWNGTGRNGVGTSGAQYASDYQNALKAAAHPKNAPLVQLIQSGLDAGARDQ